MTGDEDELIVQPHTSSSDCLCRGRDRSHLIAVLIVLLVLALIGWMVMGAVMLRRETAYESAVDNLRARAEAAENNVGCRDDLLVANGAAEKRAQRALAELLIETSEQFDRLLRGESVDPDTVHDQISVVRGALDDSDRAGEAYSTALADCDKE